MSGLASRERPQWHSIERKAVAAESDIHIGVNSDELSATVAAAELYLQALRLVDNQDDKKRLDKKTRELLARAERLKNSHDVPSRATRQRPGPSRLEYPVSTRQLTKREQIIILEGSKLNGAVFKPWAKAPLDEEFILKDGEGPFVDPFEYSLSEMQLKHFAAWKRPRDALAHIDISKDGHSLPNEVTMMKQGIWDMVQDVAPDCSVVASLCVGSARVEKGHQRLVGRIVWPYDHEEETPRESENGKYILRYYFNGCWRRVEIDDLLPASNSARVLHVVNRTHPGLIWPTIVEKAYLKVRGGYNFPGSNSGTDLAVLAGWIPQQIFLHDEDVEAESLWAELLSAFSNGEIMCTLGTGKLSQREQRLLGLGAEHDYAVLEIRQSGDQGELLIKNPWADGDVWKGATRARPNPGHENDMPQSPMTPEETEEMKPGTFWMDFHRVFQYFEHLYLNWNPGLFSHRQDTHFTWQMTDTSSADTLVVDNPQYAIKASAAGEVWILLNRHFRTGDYSVENHGKNGYISLYLFDNDGTRVFSSENAKERGPFVDSPNTLLRFQAKARQKYTVIAVSQSMPVGKHNFTLSVFANATIDLNEAVDIFQSRHELAAAWTRSTAGGSSNSSTYLQNPQFRLDTSADTQIGLVLRTSSEASPTKTNADIHVKALLASSDGKRVTKLRQPDITAQSGDYRRGSAVIEATLPKGTYTIICSTFEPHQLSKFRLDLYSGLPASRTSIKALPSEGSGRFSIIPAPVIFADGVTKMIAPLIVPRFTKALVKVALSQGSSSALFKISLEQGQGPYRRCIATSASDENEYDTIATGLRIGDVDIQTSMASSQAGGLWLVLEKPTQATTETKAADVLQVEILAEEKIGIGTWTLRED